MNSDLDRRSRDGSATRVGFRSDFASRAASSRKHSRLHEISMHELGG